MRTMIWLNSDDLQTIVAEALGVPPEAVKITVSDPDPEDFTFTRDLTPIAEVDVTAEELLNYLKKKEMKTK